MFRSTIFLRGAGGFSTSEIPFSFSNRTSLIAGVGSRTAAKKDVSAGGTSPDRVFEDHTHPSQVSCLSGELYNLCAIVYRVEIKLGSI